MNFLSTWTIWKCALLKFWWIAWEELLTIQDQHLYIQVRLESPHFECGTPDFVGQAGLLNLVSSKNLETPPREWGNTTWNENTFSKISFISCIRISKDFQLNWLPSCPWVPPAEPGRLVSWGKSLLMSKSELSLEWSPSIILLTDWRWFCESWPPPVW